MSSDSPPGGRLVHDQEALDTMVPQLADARSQMGDLVARLDARPRPLCGQEVFGDDIVRQFGPPWEASESMIDATAVAVGDLADERSTDTKHMSDLLGLAERENNDAASGWSGGGARP